MRLPGPLSLAVWMLASFASPAFATLPFVTHLHQSGSRVPNGDNAPRHRRHVRDHLRAGAGRRAVRRRARDREPAPVRHAGHRLRRRKSAVAARVRSRPATRRTSFGGRRDSACTRPTRTRPPQIVSEPFAFTVEPTCGGRYEHPAVREHDRHHARPTVSSRDRGPLQEPTASASASAVRSRTVASVSCESSSCRRPIVGPGPQPPIVRVVVDDNIGCVRRLCREDSIPWRGVHGSSTTAGGRIRTDRPAGGRDVRRGHRPQSRVPNDSGLRRRWTVARQPCLYADFITDRRPSTCDAQVSPTQPADLSFGVASDVAARRARGPVRPRILRVSTSRRSKPKESPRASTSAGRLRRPAALTSCCSRTRRANRFPPARAPRFYPSFEFASKRSLGWRFLIARTCSRRRCSARTRRATACRRA